MVIDIVHHFCIEILLFSAKTVRKVCQFGRRRLRGQGILLGVEALEGGGVADEDLGELPGQASCGGDGLSLDTLADVELESAVAVGRRALGDVDGDGLRVAAPGPPRLEALLGGWRGRHGVLIGSALAAGFQEDVQDGRSLLLCKAPRGSLSLSSFSPLEGESGRFGYRGN